jgi:hypothetical protein
LVNAPSTSRFKQTFGLRTGRIELRRCNLTTLVRLGDEVLQSMLARWPSRIWKGTSSPRRRLLQPDGENHETCIKRPRRWCSNSATVYLRWRNLSPPLQWSGAPAGTLSFVLLCDDPDAPAGRWHHWAAYDIPPTVTELAVDAAQKRQIEAGGQRFSEGGLWRPVSTSWPWASSLSRPAACSLDGPASGKRPTRPAVTLSERHASTPSRKRSLSVGMRDSPAGCRDQQTKNDGAETKTARISVDGRYNGNPGWSGPYAD